MSHLFLTEWGEKKQNSDSSTLSCWTQIARLNKQRSSVRMLWKHNTFKANERSGRRQRRCRRRARGTWMTACGWCSCEAGSLLAAGAGLLLHDPPSPSHPMTSGRVKILPKISLQQHRDLTLYYTGLYMSTARMQRCPPLNLWFSAARVSSPPAPPRPLSSPGEIYGHGRSPAKTLRLHRKWLVAEGATHAGMGQRHSPFWAEWSWAATFCFSPPSLTLVGGGTAACFSPGAEEKKKKSDMYKQWRGTERWHKTVS